MAKIWVWDCLKSGFKLCEIWVVVRVRVFKGWAAFIKSGDAGWRWRTGVAYWHLGGGTCGAMGGW